MPQPHPGCPSTAQLWTAARAELAEEWEKEYQWLGVFCDSCGTQVGAAMVWEGGLLWELRVAGLLSLYVARGWHSAASLNCRN